MPLPLMTPLPRGALEEDFGIHSLNPPLDIPLPFSDAWFDQGLEYWREQYEQATRRPASKRIDQWYESMRPSQIADRVAGRVQGALGGMRDWEQLLFRDPLEALRQARHPAGALAPEDFGGALDPEQTVREAGDVLFPSIPRWHGARAISARNIKQPDATNPKGQLTRIPGTGPNLLPSGHVPYMTRHFQREGVPFVWNDDKTKVQVYARDPKTGKHKWHELARNWDDIWRVVPASRTPIQSGDRGMTREQYERRQRQWEEAIARQRRAQMADVRRETMHIPLPKPQGGIQDVARPQRFAEDYFGMGRYAPWQNYVQPYRPVSNDPFFGPPM